MKKSLLSLLLSVSLTSLLAQSEISYPHCNCIEKISVDGQFKLTCKDNVVMKGQYNNGLRSGRWTTKTVKGAVIKNAEYVDGKLDGQYELFDYEGNPKLVASFKNGLPDGVWKYFNEKGKIIKIGKYEEGKPMGTWSVFDKNGKKEIVTYNFDDANSSNTIAPPYHNKMKIERDDQSGEWFIIYYPERNPVSDVQPLGGYPLACDLFIKYMTIPSVMMNTYTNFDFNVHLVVEKNSLQSVSSTYEDQIRYNSALPALPFIVSTNPPAKLKKVEHDKHTMELLRQSIEETVILAGPWISSSPVDIYIPFVLNDIRK